jgi:Leucine-rich repeat (LRR) protein
LTYLPKTIGNLTQLQLFLLTYNKIKKIPKSIKNIKRAFLNTSSYDINNLDLECEFLIIYDLGEPLTNLPFGLKELWLNINHVSMDYIKIPFGCDVQIIHF